MQNLIVVICNELLALNFFRVRSANSLDKNLLENIKML